MNEKSQITFDRDGWVKVSRIAVVISVVLWIAMAAVLLLAPSPYQCPEWHLRHLHSSSLWETWLLWGGITNGFGCLIAVRPNRILRQAIESDANFGIPATHQFASMCILSSVGAQFPLVLLLTTCF